MSFLRPPKTIKGKLILSFFVIFVLSGFAAAAAIYALYRVEDKMRIIESFYELNQKIFEVRSHEKNFLLYENTANLMLALDELDEVRSALASMESFGLIPYPSGRFAGSACQVEIEAYSNLMRQFISPNLAQHDVDNLKNRLRQHGHALMKCVMGIDGLAKKRVERDALHYKAVALALLVTAFPVCIGLGIFLTNWIMAPLLHIRSSVAKVMKGEIATIPAESTGTCIECTELINVLNGMIKALSDKHQQLIQAEKLAALGKVTAGIAHEINNPLNNISLTAEVLMEDLANMDCDERRGMIRDIIVQVDRAREIVRNLLDFSRSRRPMAWIKVDLVGLLNNTLALLKNQVKLSGIETKIDMPETSVPIMGNPGQLQQVFVNIILNALQAMKNGGVLGVKVSSLDKKGKAVVEISDTGPGIPQDVKEHMFEPFFTTKADGTGLGLSVSYGIIKEHKGEIVVKSEPGHGSVFEVELPLWS
ncbi:MAG: sensor histidine kinase [Dissulfurimicrobium sp.]|uniref:sensor histidine kinase n=1 Tax=Dissulfurimicrobium TaxID=1769732 RepID=UPI003C757C0C